MIEIVLLEEAEEDLGRIRVKSPAAERRLLAVLEALEDDVELQRNLHKSYYRTYGDADADIKKWVVAAQLGCDIHRLRAFYIEENGFNYRVIYALDRNNDYCYILAIVPRSVIDYDDPNNDLNKRIFASYNALDL